MPITQSRLISLIEAADETLARLKALSTLGQKYLLQAKNEGGSSAPAPLLYQILLDLNDGISRHGVLSMSAFETLTIERTHFKYARKTNEHTRNTMRRLRGREGRFLYDGDPMQHNNQDDSIDSTSPKEANLADILPIIFNAYSNNPNTDGSYLTGPQLMTTLSTQTGILDETQLRKIIETLAQEDYLIPSKTLPDDWFLNSKTIESYE